LAQDLLHAFNCVGLSMKQMANSTKKLKIFGTIVASSTTTLHRLVLVKLQFPEAEHVLRHIEFIRYFTDGTECLCGLAHCLTPLVGSIHRDCPKLRSCDFRQFAR